MEFDHGTETISPDDTVTTITIGGTGGLILPAGTTAQRPANTTGIMRWNTDLGALEVNNGSGFGSVGGGGGGAPTDATYVTLSANATLTGERVLTVGSGMVLTDAGAGNNATIEKRYGGETWTTVTSPSIGTGWRGMAYGNGTFVMLEGGTSSTAAIYSKNGGESWTSVTLPTSLMWTGCAYGNGIFVAAGALASNSVITSPDGITWTNQAAVLPDTSTHSSISFANGAFYIQSYNTTTISRSYNGIQWFQSTLPSSTTWQATGGGDGVVIAVASNTTAAARSIDGGVTFSAITLPSALDWRSVAYGDGTFIVIPSTAANNVAARSTDGGATWSTTTLPTLQTWYDIVYANGVFLATSSDGFCARSLDGGVTWTSYALPFSSAYSVMFGDGRFVIGGSTNTTAYSLAGDANNAGGNLGSILYSDRGGLNAAQNVGVIGENLWIAPSNYAAPPSRGISVFGREYGPPNGGRVMLAVTGPSGLDYPLQPALWRQGIALWRPPGNATTVPGVFGFNAPTAGGTATARTVAVTNALTRSKRLGYVSSTTAGNYGGHYSTVAQFTVGTGVVGGFMYSCRFGASDATIQTAARTFVGLTSSVAAPTNVDPATLTNTIGIGATAADTTWYIYYGGSAAQTRISLGANFPINNTDIMDITLWSPPASNGVVYYHVTRISATAQYESSGKLGPGTAGTTLPANTTLLSHRAWRNNNTAAAAVGLDIISVYIETDW